jgi:hypothetical protein
LIGGPVGSRNGSSLLYREERHQTSRRNSSHFQTLAFGHGRCERLAVPLSSHSPRVEDGRNLAGDGGGNPSSFAMSNR